MVPVFFKVLVIVLAASKYEHTYTLYPKDPNILQD